MRRLISQFVDFPRPVQIALMAMGGASIITLIYLVGQRDLKLLAIVAIGICVVVVMLLAYRALRKHLKKRKAKPFEREIKASSSAVPQGVSDVADRAHLDGMRKRFEEGIAKFRDRGKDLYTVPWYVFIGESGSGKTEAIRHCGIKFPPGLQDELQGTGGTINMDWWFTDHGVILDTAGRIVFGDVESVDTKEWHEFLGLLQKHRKHCPINGLLLAIPIDSLIQDDATEIEQKAGKIAREMDQLQRMLGVRFPVYVLVTKADKLTGFRQFFNEFRDPQAQAQMLGWSNPTELDDPFDPSSIKNSVDQIRERLDRKRLALLQDPVNTEDQSARRTDQVDELYAFPEAVQRIASRLQRYLELIFTTGIWSSKPLFLRGIYFTSSMQHGKALDLELADALNVPIESLQEAAWTEDKAYFLRDVFQEKIFKEWGLVTGHTNIRRVQRRRRIALLGSGFAAAIIIAGLTIWNWYSYRSSIGDHVTFWEKAAETFEAGKNLSIMAADEGDFFYMGGSAIARNATYWKDDLPKDMLPKGVSLKEWSSEERSNLFNILVLADERQRDEISTPWTFRPVAWVKRGQIGFETERQEAFQNLFDQAVLRPLLDHARTQFAKTDNWSAVKTNALAHLIEVQERGVISEDFVPDQLRFLLGQDYAEVGDEAITTLSGILDRLYGGSEGRDPATLSPSLRVDPAGAIESAIAKLKDYWAGPAQLEKYRELLTAVQVFEEAEQQLLKLASSSSVSKIEWEGRYLPPQPASVGTAVTKGLRDASNALTVAIAECGLNTTSGNGITDLRTLEQALAALRGDAKGTFDTLLAAATGDRGANIDVPPDTLGTVAAQLVSVWEKLASDGVMSLQATSSQIARVDKYHLGPVQDPPRSKYNRLYELRSAMYRTAHDLYDNQPRATDLAFGDTAERFQKINSDIVAAGETLTSFMDQRPADLSADDDLYKRFEEAKKLCDLISTDTAKKYLRGVVAQDFRNKLKGLGTQRLIADEIEGLWTSADREEKKDYELPKIPLTNLKLNPRYYPPAALSLLADWKAMTAAVEEFEDGTLRAYTRDYFEYWSDGVFTDLKLTNDLDWPTLQDALKGYGEPEFTVPLLQLAEDVNMRLKELKGRLGKPTEIPLVDVGIDTRIGILSGTIKDTDNIRLRYRTDFERVLENWRKLRGTATVARRVVLDADDFARLYSIRDPGTGADAKAENFIKRFWQQFSVDALSKLVTAMSAESDEIVRKLNGLQRFPLAADLKEGQLTREEVIEAKNLISQIFTEAPQMEKPSSGESIDDGEIAELLESLRSPLLDVDTTRFQKWHKLLAALPGKDETYEADLYVTPADPPSSPERKRASVKWHYLDQVTDPNAKDTSGRKNILASDDQLLRIVQYPDFKKLYLRFYLDVDSQDPDPAVLMVDRDGKVRDLVLAGPWAILHLLYACEGQPQPLESVKNGWKQIWRAELIIQPDDDDQQYSIWLEVRFKNAELPRLEDWPDEDPVSADNAP